MNQPAGKERTGEELCFPRSNLLERRRLFVVNLQEHQAWQCQSGRFACMRDKEETTTRQGGAQTKQKGFGKGFKAFPVPSCFTSSLHGLLAYIKVNEVVDVMERWITVRFQAQGVDAVPQRDGAYGIPCSMLLGAESCEGLAEVSFPSRCLPPSA